MGIDHRRLDVAMAQKFLDRSNIVAAFEQVSREGIPTQFLMVLLELNRVNAFYDRLKLLSTKRCDPLPI